MGVVGAMSIWCTTAALESGIQRRTGNSRTGNLSGLPGGGRKCIRRSGAIAGHRPWTAFARRRLPGNRWLPIVFERERLLSLRHGLVGCLLLHGDSCHVRSSLR
jgi:hypothetical protein